MKRAPLAALVLLAACAGQQKTGPDVVQVRPEYVEIKDQGFTTFTPMAVIPLENAAPVQVTDATYEIIVKGEKVGGGTVQLGRTVQPGEKLEVVADPMPYATGDKMGDVLEINGSLPLLMRGEIHAGGTSYAFSKAGNVRTPRIPTVKIWHIEVTTYAEEERLAVLFFVRVVNKNPFDLQLEELSYDLTVGGKKLVTGAVAGTKEVIGAATGGQIELPLDITKQNFGDVKKYLRTWTSLPYKLDGEVHLGVGRMPVALSGELGDEGDRFDESESKEQTPPVPVDDDELEE
jgi:LEA14-like dessication related protein